MTTCPSADVATAVPPSVHRDAPEIVAWLVDDGSASAVARTAFREAAHRGGWVRFVELTPANTLASSGAEHERAAFRAVLQARGRTVTGAVFVRGGGWQSAHAVAAQQPWRGAARRRAAPARR